MSTLEDNEIKNYLNDLESFKFYIEHIKYFFLVTFKQ